jgi:hypothetical protein
MLKNRSWLTLGFIFVLALSLTACSGGGSSPAPKGPTKAAELTEEEKEILEVRSKLSTEDRALVDAQEWCVVSSDEKLGSMGAPIKLSIKGQPVFVCCGGCKRKAEADPDKTLAKIEELKAKAKAAK